MSHLGIPNSDSADVGIGLLQSYERVGLAKAGKIGS